MRWLFKTYEKLLFRHPILLQSFQTGILVASGDVISQTIVEKNPLQNLDYKRTLQYFSMGAFYLGPALTMWYRVLHKYIGSSGKYSGLKKMSADQICFAPIALAGTVLTTNILQGNNFGQIKHSFNEVYPEILLANYKIWPAVQLINFYYVPLHYQVLYVQVFALLWNTYICFKTRPQKSE